MKERPILFSGKMVSAILEGRKTQTRRVVFANSKTNKGVDFAASIIEKDPGQVQDENWFAYPEHGNGKQIVCPYGQPGDRLWVRETWMPLELRDGGTDGVCFKADGLFIPIENSREAAGKWIRAVGSDDAYAPHWRPSIHMPRWASRITLEIAGVRCERLHDISEADAAAEGVTSELGFEDARSSFAETWVRINGMQSWNANPWVWVIEFKRVKQ